MQLGSEDIFTRVVLNGRDAVKYWNLGAGPDTKKRGDDLILRRTRLIASMESSKGLPMSMTEVRCRINNDAGETPSWRCASPHFSRMNIDCGRYILFDISLGELEWDELSQNPFLAFYQRWPWLAQILHSINLWTLSFTFCICSSVIGGEHSMENGG